MEKGVFGEGIRDWEWFLHGQGCGLGSFREQKSGFIACAESGLILIPEALPLEPIHPRAGRFEHSPGSGWRWELRMELLGIPGEIPAWILLQQSPPPSWPCKELPALPLTDPSLSPPGFAHSDSCSCPGKIWESRIEEKPLAAGSEDGKTPLAQGRAAGICLRGCPEGSAASRGAGASPGQCQAPVPLGMGEQSQLLPVLLAPCSSSQGEP